MLQRRGSTAVIFMIFAFIIADASVGSPKSQGGIWQDEPVPCKYADPSHGALCFCAVIAGLVTTDDAGFYEFVRDGRNSCHWRSQQGDGYHHEPCVLHFFEFFTISETCAAHTVPLLDWRGRLMSHINTGCVKLTPKSLPRRPDY